MFLRRFSALALPAFLILGHSAAASEADAAAISRNIRARHVPYGTILDPVFSTPDGGDIVSYTRCGDSAIWTGHFLAAEAFRFKATRSAEALDNVKAAIAGIKSLADVTGTNLLARCLVPMNSPYALSITQEEQHSGMYTNNSAGYYWVGNTSRDQYSGVFFGLAVAYDNVDDAGVRSSIKDLVTRLLDFLRGHDWIVRMPDGAISTTFIGRADQQLSFLQVGRHINSDRYSTAYDVDKFLLSAGVTVPIALEITDNASYFKFNLDTINLFDLVRLEGSSLKGVYEGAYGILRNHTSDQQNAFFNMVDRALKGPDAKRDAETVQMLNDWLQRPKRDVAVDLTGKLASCNRADEACSPVPVALRPSTDFLWQRNPFKLTGAGAGTIESAGIDYILPYWMARVYGVVRESAVYSAASGTNSVASESVAAWYGSNLASSTAAAQTLPLPASLAGVSVMVQDSAGAIRAAPLFYVSPTQINFEIPPGTAAGQANVTVNSSSGAAVATSAAFIEAVAPAVFTADASGTGAPAAFVIQVGVNGLQSSAPAFQCVNGSCQPAPILLGVDRPTYLILYGTGIRNRSSLTNVSVTVRGAKLPAAYAGPQGSFAGLDQVNVMLPLGLRGSGVTDLLLTVDGQTANTVRINIQ